MPVVVVLVMVVLVVVMFVVIVVVLMTTGNSGTRGFILPGVGFFVVVGFFMFFVYSRGRTRILGGGFPLATAAAASAAATAALRWLLAAFALAVFTLAFSGPVRFARSVFAERLVQRFDISQLVCDELVRMLFAQLAIFGCRFLGSRGADFVAISASPATATPALARRAIFLASGLAFNARRAFSDVIVFRLGLGPGTLLLGRRLEVATRPKELVAHLGQGFHRREELLDRKAAIEGRRVATLGQRRRSLAPWRSDVLGSLHSFDSLYSLDARRTRRGWCRFATSLDRT